MTKFSFNWPNGLILIEAHYKMPHGPMRVGRKRMEKRMKLLYRSGFAQKPVHSQEIETRSQLSKNIKSRKRGQLICQGKGLGTECTLQEYCRLLEFTQGILIKLNVGEILVLEETDPDWDPDTQKSQQVLYWDQGGRTSMRQCVARKWEAVAIVGSGNATRN